MIYALKNPVNKFCYLLGQERWHGITYLIILLCARSFKEVIVGKCLKPSSFSHCQAAALQWVGMDEIMSVFGNMRYNRRRRGVWQLDTESVIKDYFLRRLDIDIPVLRIEVLREIGYPW